MFKWRYGSVITFHLWPKSLVNRIQAQFLLPALYTHVVTIVLHLWPFTHRPCCGPFNYRTTANKDWGMPETQIFSFGPVLLNKCLILIYVGCNVCPHLNFGPCGNSLQTAIADKSCNNINSNTHIGHKEFRSVALRKELKTDYIRQAAGWCSRPARPTLPWLFTRHRNT